MWVFKDLSPDLNEEQLLAFAGKSLAVALTWDYLDWLRSSHAPTLFAERNSRKEDALMAVSKGIEGIIVFQSLGAGNWTALGFDRCFARNR
jgi:hypothetical protein